MGSGKHKLRLGFGIFFGAFFMYLAIRKVEFSRMLEALKSANYWYLLPTIAVYFFSHLLRALRWRYLLDPIKSVDIGSLFSSLIIGYMANVVTPAHLGELLRAYVLGKKRHISTSSVFATIVTERIIDVLTLVALMVVGIFIYPFPSWVKNSGYIMLAGTLGLLAFLGLLKKMTSSMHMLINYVLKPFPPYFPERAKHVLERFVSGIVPLKHQSDYIVVAFLSVVIWVCYGLAFYFTLQGFDFVRRFQLPWSVSLILLVITSIAVVIPSSPGYVGIYHYLCQVSLAMFGVPAGPALSFATVMHGINFFPVLVVGLLFAYHEGVGISRVPAKATLLGAKMAKE